MVEGSGQSPALLSTLTSCRGTRVHWPSNAMELQACLPDSRTYMAAVKACTSLGARDDREIDRKWFQRGKSIHSQAVMGKSTNPLVENMVMSMYAKHGSLRDVQAVFDNMAHRTVASWNVLLQACVQSEESERAMRNFQGMEEAGSCVPDGTTFVAALRACASLAEKEDTDRSERWLEVGKSLHSRAVLSSCCSLFVETALVNLYAKCGNMVHARGVFDEVVNPDVVIWTALLQGYIENGKSELALEIFNGMLEHNCNLNSRTFVAALTACVKQIDKPLKSGKWLERGKALHSQAVMASCCDSFVERMLIKLYTTQGCLQHARCLFDGMTSEHDVTSWTALLQGFVENGQNELALDLLDKTEESCVPDARTYVVGLAACASASLAAEHRSSKWLEKGKALHSQAVANQCADTFVNNMLVDMYGKCGSMLHARRVFEDLACENVVAWTALLQGYVENGASETALKLFDEGDQCGCAQNAVTYGVGVMACASLGAQSDEKLKKVWLERGKFIHSRAAMDGVLDKFVENNLIHMYGCCSGMLRAHCVFENMLMRDIVSWNALITGYVKAGQNEQALKLIAEMSVAKDCATFLAGLEACSNLQALETGRAMHQDICSYKLDKDTAVANCLVDFYGKCGSMHEAKLVFDSIPHKTIVSWNSLMNGYSQQGNAEKIFELFNLLTQPSSSILPDELTFISILNACSHAGLIAKGKQYFNTMRSKFGITPTIVLYNCMIDLLGRANQIDEALQLVDSMPLEPTAVTWRTLLSACRKWNNREVGEVAYQALMKLDQDAPAGYNLMANIYAGII